MSKKIMERASERRKKITSSFVMLLITVIALTTATYAWFTQTTIAELAGVQVNVEATTGIQVSMDAVGWFSALPVGLIKGVGWTSPGENNTNQIPDTLVPVSTGGVIDANGMMEMFRGTVRTNALAEQILISERTATENSNADFTASEDGNFIVFDMFVRATEPGMLSITPTSSVVYVGDSRGLENAARVAFIKMGETPSMGRNIEIVTSKHPITTGPVANSVVFWEPNNNAHTESALTYGRDVAGLQDLTSSTILPSWQGVKSAFNDGDNVPLNFQGQASHSSFNDFFNVIEPQISTNTTFTTHQNLFPIIAGITKIRIYAWVEGQDIDCEDEASGSDIIFNLRFSLG